MIGSPLGKDVNLKCVVEAFPKSVNTWKKKNVDSDGKFLTLKCMFTMRKKLRPISIFNFQ